VNDGEPIGPAPSIARRFACGTPAKAVRISVRKELLDRVSVHLRNKEIFFSKTMRLPYYLRNSFM
jgi:hypothetical protein